MQTDQMEQLEPGVVGYWRLSGIVVALTIFAFVALQSAPFLLTDATIVAWWILGVSGALVLLRVTWILVTTRMRFRRMRFSADTTLLRVQHGVLIHRELVIPVSRLQHIDVDRGPIERLFGLASLSVFTAGGRRATFRIPGLSPERAEALRARVLRTLDGQA